LKVIKIPDELYEEISKLASDKKISLHAALAQYFQGGAALEKAIQAAYLKGNYDGYDQGIKDQAELDREQLKQHCERCQKEMLHYAYTQGFNKCFELIYSDKDLWEKSGNIDKVEISEKISKKPISLQDAIEEALQLKAFIYGIKGKKMDWATEEAKLSRALGAS
jgi:hypothetical protein